MNQISVNDNIVEIVGHFSNRQEWESAKIGIDELFNALERLQGKPKQRDTHHSVQLSTQESSNVEKNAAARSNSKRGMTKADYAEIVLKDFPDGLTKDQLVPRMKELGWIPSSPTDAKAAQSLRVGLALDKRFYYTNIGNRGIWRLVNRSEGDSEKLKEETDI